MKRANKRDGDKTELVRPIECKATHGAKVVSLLAGKKFGACQSRVFVVRRPNEQSVDGRDKDTLPVDYTTALNLIRVHYEQKKKKTRAEPLHGVLNISVGFDATDERKNALQDVINEGIVVVGAAGNDGVGKLIHQSERSDRVQQNLDEIPAAKLKLPESNKNVILIGSLNQDGTRSTSSNFGKRKFLVFL